MNRAAQALTAPTLQCADDPHANAGFAWGLVGVAIFSLTLPFTRMAVAALDPLFVGLGRAVVAALCAGTLLIAQRAPLPERKHWFPLLLVAAGVVIGFPAFSSLAMRAVPAAHGAVLIGLLPLATAVVAVWRAHERPSRAFWVAALLGSALVIAFAISEAIGAGHGLALQAADVALLVAVVCAAVGYAEGGRLASMLGGSRTICWALLMSLPALLPIVVWRAWANIDAIRAAPMSAWIGFGYVSLFSMFLGFFAWYRGLALGGIARVGQVQLLQIFFTLAFAALVFGEDVPWSTWAFAAAVIATVAFARRARVARPPAKG